MCRKLSGASECPGCGEVGREGQLTNVACPSRSRLVSSAFCRRCPRIAAAATPELRNRTTPAGFRQRRFVRAVTRSMCWQKFDPPLDPRTHLAIRFGSRNSHSMRFKRRPSPSQITCGAQPLNPRIRPWQGRAPARLLTTKHKLQNQIRKRRRAATPRGGIGPKLTTMRCVPCRALTKYAIDTAPSIRAGTTRKLLRSTGAKIPKRRSKMLLDGFLRSAASAPARWLWSFSGLRLPG
jgi:hypothetical protein